MNSLTLRSEALSGNYGSMAEGGLVEQRQTPSYPSPSTLSLQLLGLRLPLQIIHSLTHLPYGKKYSLGQGFQYLL